MESECRVVSQCQCLLVVHFTFLAHGPALLRTVPRCEMQELSFGFTGSGSCCAISKVLLLRMQYGEPPLLFRFRVQLLRPLPSLSISTLQSFLNTLSPSFAFSFLVLQRVLDLAFGSSLFYTSLFTPARCHLATSPITGAAFYSFHRQFIGTPVLSNISLFTACFFSSPPSVCDRVLLSAGTIPCTQFNTLDTSQGPLEII